MRFIDKIFGLFYKKNFERISYSQEGEDLLLERIIGKEKSNGFYIDIGAHHPFKFSNTYLFYEKGWHGINIEAMPESIALFKKFRQRDVSLEIAVSDKKERLSYYIFNFPEVNTFVEEHALEWDGKGPVKKIGTKLIDAEPIDKILERLISIIPQKIDFISIDIEGMDFKILKAIDLNKFNISYIVIEQSNISAEKIIMSPIYKYLEEFGYSLESKLYNSVIYKKNL